MQQSFQLQTLTIPRLGRSSKHLKRQIKSLFEIRFFFCFRNFPQLPDALLQLLDFGLVTDAQAYQPGLVDQFGIFVDLLIGVLDLLLVVSLAGRAVRDLLLPYPQRHDPRQLQRLPVDGNRFQHPHVIFLYFEGVDILRAGYALFIVASVVGIVLGTALADASGQLFAAEGAVDHPPQGKFQAVSLAWRPVWPRQFALDLFVGFLGDDCLVASFPAGYPPLRVLDDSGVDRLGQQSLDVFDGNALLADAAQDVQFLVNEEPAQVGLGQYPVLGEGVQSLGYDIGERPDREEQLAVLPVPEVLVAGRGDEAPVAPLHPVFHLLADLPTVLLALQLVLGCEDSFHELSFGAVVEVVIEAAQAGFPGFQLRLEPDVHFHVAGEALEVVEDDDVLALPMAVQILEQGLYCGTLEESSGYAFVPEYAFHLKS